MKREPKQSSGMRKLEKQKLEDVDIQTQKSNWRESKRAGSME